jgi:putative transposase
MIEGEDRRQTTGEFPHLRRTFWGRPLWARGYFCCSAGNVTNEVMADYIADQSRAQDEDFKVEG